MTGVQHRRSNFKNFKAVAIPVFLCLAMKEFKSTMQFSGFNYQPQLPKVPFATVLLAILSSNANAQYATF